MITIYSTSTCPKCNVVKMKLSAKGIEYTECNDIEILQSLGIMSVPAMKIDDGDIINDFNEINTIVNNL